MKEKEKQEFDLKQYINNNHNFRIVCLGLTGSGKTFFSRKLITTYINLKKRNCIVCDTKHEFTDIKTFNPLIDLSQKGIIRRVLAINVKDQIFDTPNEIAEYCCAVGWEWKPCLTYLEEVVSIIPSKQESLATSHKNIFTILQLGRANLSDILVATQKATQLHEAFLDESTDIFVFAVSKTESEALEKKLGLEKGSLLFNIPDLTKKPLDKLSKEEWLDLYSFVRINQMRQITWYKPIEFHTKLKTGKSEFKNEQKE